MHKPLLQRIHIAALVAAAGAAPLGALAAESPATTLSQILSNSGITESGYVAASYFHSTGVNSDHQFDTGHDTFQLDQAGLTLAYQPKSGFGAVVDVIAGEDAKIVDYAESAGASASSFDLLQGYAQYVSGPLTVQAGKFTTLAGAEVIAPTGNANYSRSLLFYGEPMTHTGLRATYAVNDMVSVIVGVNNGWNYTKLAGFSSKTGEFGLALAPARNISLTAQAYVGRDPVVGASRTFFDTVATYNATSTLSLAASFDWGKQAQAAGPDLKWDGIAGYVNYQLSGQWRVSLRGEYFDDKGGFITGTSQKVKEGTVTVGYDPVSSFELRLEARYDSSNAPTFVKWSSSAPTGNQTEVALQSIFRF
ncbi:MAG TPA: outer membrane beta-barrel protein [Steroidobacteraceae bacterium]|nr:outer membrane beta-barrel protein [Steroidobacteraceae bacterium]